MSYFYVISTRNRGRKIDILQLVFGRVQNGFTKLVDNIHWVRQHRPAAEPGCRDFRIFFKRVLYTAWPKPADFKKSFPPTNMSMNMHKWGFYLVSSHSNPSAILRIRMLYKKQRQGKKQVLDVFAIESRRASGSRFLFFIFRGIRKLEKPLSICNCKAKSWEYRVVSSTQTSTGATSPRLFQFQRLASKKWWWCRWWWKI